MVRLETNAGEFVAVAEVAPSPFSKPDVLIWGNRTFSRDDRWPHVPGTVYAEVSAARVETSWPGPDNGIREPVDRKFHIHAVCREHGHVHTEHDGVLFLAKDLGLLVMLAAYRDECVRLGAAPEQLLGIDLLRDRIAAYQAANPKLLKVADVDLALGAHIVAPNRGA